MDAIPVHEARVLTEGGLLAGIVLDGQVYSLRITCSGKLILTKQGLGVAQPKRAVSGKAVSEVPGEKPANAGHHGFHGFCD